tara:strand:+ start:338 stop:2776 length:2439 start_codon:yes stop_codon:yes gene_type:complete
MYNNNQKSKQGFPDPLEPTEVKESKEYGIQYAKAIESQWGNTTDDSSLVGKRNRVFEKDRDYATGVQDTSIYKQLLNSLQPNKGDGSLLNIDYTPVPILPKFVRIVVNKILSINPYPNLEAIDPVSSSEKNLEKNRIQLQVKQKEKLKQLKEKSGITLDMDPDQIPETLEEAEIFYETNVKTTGEISAQLGTELTLNWNGFADSTFRRCVNDLATLGMSVVKRSNDPNEGIKVSYVDPSKFIHSYTEDPNFDDLIYAGHIKKISISELKRIASHELTEEDFKEIAKKSRGKNGNDASKYEKKYFNDRLGRTSYGYDDYMVHVLDFEFMSVDCMNFEEKENKFGNTGFYFKGFNYKPQKNSVFERKPHKMEIATVYGGSYILGCDYLFDYGRSKNIPKNIHDISKARLSYSVVSTNIRNMIPKSMVDSCVGFADMLQLTHLKIQQAIAKAKPDGLIIDIEGLENVQLGKGGELQPLDLHDIYEQTGVFYYRSKNAEGGFQNPPVREIGNSIRNINELIGLYNHYLRLIRDTTGINEAMDASSPKGDALVGVQQQAIAAGNNAIYDITNASLMLYKKVCEDIVKCLQIIPSGSVLYNVYENAIGKTNMKALKSFKDLPMYNFGVVVVKDMEEKEKAFLEQNIQMALQQKEIDLEDAIAVRALKDINQAERLLIVRRKKRMAMMQQMAMQQSQQQAQQQAQLAQQAQEAKMAQMKAEAELDAQKTQMEAEISMKMEQMKHEFRREIEMIKAQATLGFKEDDKNFREKLEILKEDRKDERLTKQTSDQSKLISQRQGKRQEVEGDGASLINELLKQ